MLKLKSTLAVILCVFALASCKKATPVSYEDQAKADDKLILEFIAKNNLVMTKEPNSGLYYSIKTPGSGVGPAESSTIRAKYEGRLLNGSVFDKSTDGNFQFQLRQVIKGWQVGVPMIQEGGEIRLLVPSGLAYGSYPPTSAIPKNAVLDFTIQITKIL